jgi:hypothetical protein
MRGEKILFVLVCAKKGVFALHSRYDMLLYLARIIMSYIRSYAQRRGQRHAAVILVLCCEYNFIKQTSRRLPLWT